MRLGLFSFNKREAATPAMRHGEWSREESQTNSSLRSVASRMRSANWISSLSGADDSFVVGPHAVFVFAVGHSGTRSSLSCATTSMLSKCSQTFAER